MAVVAYAEARKRIGSSKFYLGPSLTLNKSNITAVYANGNPLPPGLEQEIDQTALGLILTYDDLDNQFTPFSGVNFNLSARSFTPALGGESEFVAGKMFGAVFYSPDDRWTISGMALAEATFGYAPFFMEPSIALRGVPYNRYQGDRVLSTEIEIRRRVSDRWTLLGFAGYGYATAQNTLHITGSSDAIIYGAGFRYRLARRLGIDFGMDFAVGPEINIVYFTFGQAWGRHMK